MVNVIDLPLSEYISKTEKSDIDLPLADIISKKRIILKKPKLEGIVKAKTVVARPAGNMKTVTRTITTGKVGDARNHIIQKKRLQFVDARDQLASIAKTGDARSRLNLKRTDGTTKMTGGIPALMKEIESAKPVDMRQKLNLKRAGPAQVKKNFSITQQKTGLQIKRAAPVGQTRMQGSSLVRTVSTASPHGLMANNGSSAAVIEFHRSHPIQQQQQVVAQPSTLVVRNTVPLVQQARPIQVARRRVVPAVRNTVYTTARPRQQLVAQAPQTVYRQVPVRRGYSAAAAAPRPLMEAPIVTTARARLEPRASSGYISRSAMVASNDGYHQPQRSTVVYSQEPQVIYQDEEPLEYEYEDELLAVEPPLQEDEVYYQERTPSPVYEQEYAQDLYVPQPAPRQQQQYYGPSAPPQPRPVAYSQSAYVSRTPQQPRSQPQRMVAQPARIQQRPQQQPQQQQRMQPQQQQRMQPQQQQQLRMQPQQQQRMQPQQLQRMQPQQLQRMQPQQQQRMQPLQQQRIQPQQQQRIQQQTRPLQQQNIRRTGPSPRQQQAVPLAPAVKVVGHKVVVSNLHPVATLEDIEELFGNIGPISSCKMTRPGTAAVIFLNFSDAQKSVEVYHNRKLDGQPMQVKIVGSVSETAPVQQQQRNISRMRY